MEKSQTLKEISKALSLFHSKMDKISKDSKNPYFNSKYASLSTILEHIQLPLAECDLTFTQLPDGDCLTTILIHHPSGEYIQSCYNIHPVKMDPQAIGSAITYARRYALSAILGLNVEDDDGNAASAPQKQYSAQPQSAAHPAIENGKVQPNANAEVDNREWLTEKQFQAAINRINGGEFDLYDKLVKEYRMKKAYREALEQALKFGEAVK